MNSTCTAESAIEPRLELAHRKRNYSANTLALLTVAVVFVGACSHADESGAATGTTQSHSTSAATTIAPRPMLTVGLIIYQGPDGLHTVQPDGTNDTVWRPDTVSARARHPDWSPDGQRVAFVADEADETTDIWVAASDGTHARKVVECAPPCSFAEDPAWSPDGEQLAFWTTAGPSDAAEELQIVAVDSGEVTRIIPAAEHHGFSHPRWSPDGQSIIVDSGLVTDTGPTTIGVGVVHLPDAAPSVTVLTDQSVSASFADWSPDGSLIAYQQGNPDPFGGGLPSDVYVANPNGTGARQLGDATTDGVSYALPSWSSDGTRLLVTVIRPAGDYRIAWIDINTGTVTELTDASANPLIGAHAMQCCA
jgi:Tol biopolymer transport system component